MKNPSEIWNIDYDNFGVPIVQDDIIELAKTLAQRLFPDDVSIPEDVLEEEVLDTAFFESSEVPVVEQDQHKLAEQTLDALLDEDSNLSPVKPMRQGSSDIVDEINAYIGCPKIMPPILAKLFRALKTIPPSSIEAERAFSTCGLFATRVRSRLNDDTLNALLITNKFYKKEKLLENEKDLAKQKLSSKPAKAAETTETVEAAVQKSLTQN